jgi:hypothetical protein
VSDRDLRELEKKIETGRDFVAWLARLSRHDPGLADQVEVRFEGGSRFGPERGSRTTALPGAPVVETGSWWWISSHGQVKLMPSSPGGSRWDPGKEFEMFSTFPGNPEGKDFTSREDLFEFLEANYLGHRSRPGVDSLEAILERRVPGGRPDARRLASGIEVECATCGAPALRLCGDRIEDAHVARCFSIPSTPSRSRSYLHEAWIRRF